MDNTAAGRSDKGSYTEAEARAFVISISSDPVAAQRAEDVVSKLMELGWPQNLAWAEVSCWPREFLATGEPEVVAQRIRDTELQDNETDVPLADRLKAWEAVVAQENAASTDAARSFRSLLGLT